MSENRPGAEVSELESVYQHNLLKWQQWLSVNCPVSVDNPAELWDLIRSNNIQAKDLEVDIRKGLVAGRVSGSESHTAAVTLKLLRDMDILPTPVDGSSPYYFEH